MVGRPMRLPVKSTDRPIKSFGSAHIEPVSHGLPCHAMGRPTRPGPTSGRPTSVGSRQALTYLPIMMSNLTVGFVSFVNSSMTLYSAFRARHRSVFSLWVLVFCSPGSIRHLFYVAHQFAFELNLTLFLHILGQVEPFAGPLYTYCRQQCIRPIDWLYNTWYGKW